MEVLFIIILLLICLGWAFVWFHSLMIAKILKRGKWSGLQWENCERKSEVIICFIVQHSSLVLLFFSLFTDGCLSTYKVTQFTVLDSLSSLLPYCSVLFLSLCSQRLSWDAHRRNWVGFLDCVCFCPADPLLMPRALVKGQSELHWL